MKKINSLRLIAVLGLCYMILPTEARSQCPDTPSKLYEIEQLYRSGHFEQIIEKGPCIQELFLRTRQNKDSLDLLSATETFFCLYIKSCLKRGLDAEAQIATEKMMQNFPRHSRKAGSDSPAFIGLLDSIVPYAANRFGLFVGPRLTFPTLLAPIDYRTDLDDSRPPMILKKGWGFNFGLEWSRHFSYRGAFVTGIAEEALGYTIIYASRNFSNNDGVKGDWRLSLKESAYYLQIPLLLQYRFAGNKNSTKRSISDVFLQGGIFGRALFLSKAKVFAESWIENAYTSDLFPITGTPPRRELLAMGGIAAFGYHLDFGNFSCFARLSGQISWLAINRKRAEYPESYATLLWQHQISDRHERLNSLNLAVGISLHKNYEVKNFMKKTPPTFEAQPHQTRPTTQSAPK